MTSGASPTPRPPSASPSKGSAAISARCARRRSTCTPPCTIPKRSWPGAAGAATQPRAQRVVRAIAASITGARRVRRRALVERHRDVARQRRLDRHRALGRQALLAAVEVRAKRHALVVDRPPIAQAEHLVAARVRQDRARPAHEPVQAAERRDPLGARAQRQVIRVAQDDARAQALDVARRQRLDGRLRPDRHEHGRLHHAMRGLEQAGARAARARDHLKCPRRAHAGVPRISIASP